MKKLTLFLISFYSKFVSPIFVALFGRACKYQKTCSQYAIYTINKNGLTKGICYSIKRVVSCNSFSISFIGKDK